MLIKYLQTAKHAATQEPQGPVPAVDTSNAPLGLTPLGADALSWRSVPALRIVTADEWAPVLPATRHPPAQVQTMHNK